MTDTKMLKEMPKRIPVNGTFELTVRCNLHCKMCLFRHDDSENEEIMQNELSAAQWIDMARQAAEAGTLTLLITGGEPMLRPDFCEIWEGIYKQGFLITLYTNATLVTDQIIETLRKFPPHSIGITIYGSEADIYKKVTGSSKAFYQMIHGTQKLLTLPSKIQFRSTIIQDNFGDVRKIEKLISEQFNFHGIVEEPRCIFPAVRGGCSKAKSVRLAPEDNVKLIFRRGIDELRERIGEQSFDKSKLKFKTVPKRKDNDADNINLFTLLGCDAGMKNYTISWDGMLLGCQTLGVFQTNALHDGLLQAWDKFPFTVKLPEQNEKCKKCEISRFCESCYASRYAETGELNGLSEYQCKDAHAIAKLINGGNFDEL